MELADAPIASYFWSDHCPSCHTGMWVADTEADLPAVGIFLICELCGFPARVRYDTEQHRRLEEIVMDATFWRTHRDAWVIYKAILQQFFTSGQWWKGPMQTLGRAGATVIIALMQFWLFRRLTWLFLHYELRRVGAVSEDAPFALRHIPRVREGSLSIWLHTNGGCCANWEHPDDPSIKLVIRCEGKVVPKYEPSTCTHPCAHCDDLSEADTSAAGTRPAP